MNTISRSTWLETGIITLICALILLFWSYSSFSKPFFAENFQYVGQFRAADGNWSKFLFSPTQDGWFKPVEKLLHILLFLNLPLRAQAYHIANFVLVLGIIILLHRYLLLYVHGVWARLIPLMYFSTLSVHLTLIGYINLFGTILVSLIYVVMIYTFSLYFVERKVLFLWLGSITAVLALFIKETAVIIFPIAFILMVAGYCTYRVEGNAHRWVWMPLIIISMGMIVYFLSKLAVLGSLVSLSTTYAPQFTFSQFWRNLLAFTSGITNTSLTYVGVTGVGGIGSVLYGHFKTGIFNAIDGLVAAFSVLWLAWLAFRARASFFPLLTAITQAATTFLIHLFTQNLQSYYRTDFLIAITIIIALALDRLTRPEYIVTLFLMFISAFNGYLSNKYSYYDWQYTGDQAEAAFLAVEEYYRPDYREVRFSTSNVDFWRYTLGRGIPYSSMIPERLGDPALGITYYEAASLPVEQCSEAAGILCIDLDNHFSRVPAEDKQP